MTTPPRRRALLNGLLVFFQSRNPELATVRWHGKFKQQYRTKADALMAKKAWEDDGDILWPADIKQQKKPKPKPMRRREAFSQQELRI